MILYSYFRSSASYRVRIGLNLKSLAYETRTVNILRGAEQHSAQYRRLNALGRVPTLVDGGQTLNQSLAILEYLDEIHPQPPLLPSSPAERAKARTVALTIACDIQPLQNTSTTAYLASKLNVDKPAIAEWLRHWITNGLTAVESMLGDWGLNGDFCVGSAPSLADACLVPQCFAARRFNVDFAVLPRIARIDAHCRSLDAFARAAPDAQPDHVP